MEKKKRSGWVVIRSWHAWGKTLYCNPETAKRDALLASASGLLQIARSSTKCDAKNKFAIDWQGIEELLGSIGQDHKSRLESGTSRLPKMGAQDAYRGALGAERGEQHAPQPLSIPLKIALATPSPFRKDQATKAVFELGPETLQEEAELFSLVAICGVDQYGPCTKAAIDRGDDVRAIVEEWRKREKAYKPEFAVHKLVKRLKNGIPGWKPCEGWPAVDFPEKLKQATAPQICKIEPLADKAAVEVRARFEAQTKEAMVKFSAMTPKERVAELLKHRPTASDFDQQSARKYPGYLALILAKPP